MGQPLTGWQLLGGTWWAVTEPQLGPPSAQWGGGEVGEVHPPPEGVGE